MKRMKPEEVQIVLVLQGEQAYWFKYSDDKVVDSFVDYISRDAESPISRCPWLRGNSNSEQPGKTIHLVLNTLMDELDHVTLDINERDFTGDIKRYLCVRRLRRDYSKATVYPLPRHECSQVASLLHHIIPDSWSHWLTALQAQSVCIASVVTATELMASWSQDVDAALLLNVSAGTERRHLVVENGKPLYLRVVPATEDQHGLHRFAGMESEIDETLRQFNRSRKSPGVKLPVVELYTDVPSPSVEWRDARTLCALRLGTGLSVKQTGSVVQDCENSAGGSLTRGDLKNARLSAGHNGTGWKLPRIIDFRHWITRRRSQWNPLRYAWSSMDALAETHRLLRLQAQLNRLKTATVGFALFGGILIVTALVQGISGAGFRQLQEEQQQFNAREAEQSIEAAQSIHHSPDAVANSIRLLDKFQISTTVRPVAVTSTIAHALSKAPEVALDRLIWAAIADSEPVEGLYASIDRVMVRDQLPGAKGVSEQVHVEIAGVVSGHDLSAQKQSLDEFIRALQENGVVSHLLVVESPVDSALSSKLVVEQSSQYRVSMIISTS